VREAEQRRRHGDVSEVEAQHEQRRREAEERRDASDDGAMRSKRWRHGAGNDGVSERGEAKWILGWSEGATFLLCRM
jgi:hypothetical protein